MISVQRNTRTFLHHTTRNNRTLPRNAGQLRHVYVCTERKTAKQRNQYKNNNNTTTATTTKHTRKSLRSRTRQATMPQPAKTRNGNEKQTSNKNEEWKRKADKTKAKDINYHFIKAEGHESTHAPHYSLTPCFCPAENIPLRAKFVPVWFITTGSHTTGEFLSEEMAVSLLLSRLS